VVAGIQAAFGPVLSAFAGAGPARPAARRGRLWDGYGPAAGSGVTLVSRPIEQANLGARL